jgi:hypothetical protein
MDSIPSLHVGIGHMSTGYNLNGANSSRQPPRRVKELDSQRHNPIFTKPTFKKRHNRSGKVKFIQIRNT